MFFGIIIRMYCGKAEHNPPHVHAYFQDSKALFSIDSGDILEGSFPLRQTRLVSAWIELHRDELTADWALASQGEHPFKIDPLR
jgi:hypothetical protein